MIPRKRCPGMCVYVGGGNCLHCGNPIVIGDESSEETLDRHCPDCDDTESPCRCSLLKAIEDLRTKNEDLETEVEWLKKENRRLELAKPDSGGGW